MPDERRTIQQFWTRYSVAQRRNAVKPDAPVIDALLSCASYRVCRNERSFSCQAQVTSAHMPPTVWAALARVAPGPWVQVSGRRMIDGELARDADSVPLEWSGREVWHGSQPYTAALLSIEGGGFRRRKQDAAEASSDTVGLRLASVEAVRQWATVVAEHGPQHPRAPLLEAWLHATKLLGRTVSIGARERAAARVRVAASNCPGRPFLLWTLDKAEGRQ